MSESSLMTTLVEIVRKAGKVAPTVAIHDQTRLVEDLGIDSLDLVAVFLTIQDQFDVTIDDEDLPALRSLSEIASYISRQRGSMAA